MKALRLHNASAIGGLITLVAFMVASIVLGIHGGVLSKRSAGTPKSSECNCFFPNTKQYGILSRGRGCVPQPCKQKSPALSKFDQMHKAQDLRK